jgi:hypothetical protein
MRTDDPIIDSNHAPPDRDANHCDSRKLGGMDSALEHLKEPRETLIGLLVDVQFSRADTHVQCLPLPPSSNHLLSLRTVDCAANINYFL